MATLTPNAVTNILADIRIPPPVLQVLDVKALASQNPAAGVRYRIILSDGDKWSQAMLGTSMNGMVESGEISLYSLMRLDEYQTNSIQSRKIIILLKVEPLGNPGVRIGTPAAVTDGATDAGTTAPTMPATHAAPPTMMPAQAAQPMHYGAAPAPQPQPHFAAPPAAPAHYTSAPAASAVPQPYGAPPAYSAPPMYGGGAAASGPTVRMPDAITGHSVVPVSSLNPYNHKWTIKVRVTSKGPIKTWSNARGTGKLFSCDLVDQEGTEIRATFFQEAVDRFYEMITPDHVYLMSQGRIKSANTKFTTIRNQYEINFDERTTITPVKDDGIIAKAVYNFVPLSNLTAVEVDKTIDVLGVIISAGAPNHITSKAGKELTKRDLVLADDSKTSVTLTLWNEKADMPGLDEGQVIAVKGARVGDYGGRSLSTSMSSVIDLHVDLPQAHKLRGWYSSGGSSTTFHQLTERGGSGGGGADGPIATVELRKPVASIRDNIGVGGDEAVQLVKACISHIRRDDPTKLWYAACPGQYDGKTCNKKLTDNGGGIWSCERGCPVTQPNYRYIMSVQIMDNTGMEYATMFDQEAQLVLKKSGNDMRALVDQYGGPGATLPPEFEAPFRSVTFREYLFTVKARMELVHDENRAKVTIVKVRELDYPRECKALTANIKKYMEMGLTAM